VIRPNISTRFGLILVLLAGTALPASAQIYTWRDSAGKLVLSNKRPETGDSIRSYAVPASTEIRTTRYAGTEQTQRTTT
jgi:hypothetical protein